MAFRLAIRVVVLQAPVTPEARIRPSLFPPEEVWALRSRLLCLPLLGCRRHRKQPLDALHRARRPRGTRPERGVRDRALPRGASGRRLERNKPPIPRPYGCEKG